MNKIIMLGDSLIDWNYNSPYENYGKNGYEDSEELKNLNYNIEADTFLNFVKARRSIRYFKEKKIEKKIIEKLLEVGRFSPTGANIQDVNYFVIQDELEKFKEAIWEGLNNFTNSDINSLVQKDIKIDL